MFDEDFYLQILIDEMALELECTAPECAHGVGGARWKMLGAEVVGQLVMVVEGKFSLQRYHTQRSVGKAVKKISSTSRERGTNMVEHPMKWMRSNSETSCCTVQMRHSRRL